MIVYGGGYRQLIFLKIFPKISNTNLFLIVYIYESSLILLTNTP